MTVDVLPSVESGKKSAQGCVNAVFADGGVKFVRDTINPATWAGLALAPAAKFRGRD
ncbi:MAG: hypothetical protein K8U57_18515 [Planctomycetes bacterium]|nr:hypothetical protein [Planctomycetota bacterium]